MSHLLQADFVLLAQQDDAAAALLGIIFIIFALALAAAAIALTVYLYWLLYTCYDRVPRPFRQMEPGMIFLMLIPCFGFVWMFFVFLQLPESFRRYFHANGRYEVGDCGYQLGLWFCICNLMAGIPYIGVIPGIVAIVLLIVYLVKVNQLKNMIPKEAAHAYAGGYAPQTFNTGVQQYPSNPFQTPGAYGYPQQNLPQYPPQKPGGPPYGQR